jgi:hypothetical protein
MRQVYRALAVETVEESGASGLVRLWLGVVWDGLTSALAQWVQEMTKRRRGAMQTNVLDRKDGIAPLSPFEAALAVLPFLLFGAANIANQLPAFQFPPGKASIWIMLVTHPYLAFNWPILMGLAGGILCGLPRWSFTYLSWALLDLLLWANVSYYGQVVNWMWLPAAAVVILALLARRALKPEKLILPGWRDLTLVALGIYTGFSSLYMIYDENHHPALLIFMAGAALAAALGVWGFFRAGSPLRRVLALAGGLLVVDALNLWNGMTWDAAAYYGLPPSSPTRDIAMDVVFFAVLAGVMVGVGWLAERLSRRKAE